MKTFIAIDFETANEKRVSACSLGIAKVVDGVICDHKTFLIHPVGEYKPINIRIHGITPERTASAPTFDKIFPLLYNELEKLPVLSYTSFDRCVLEALANHYCLELPHDTRFYDVCALAKSLLSDLPDHRLSTVSKCLGLSDYTHHDAEADALKCAEVYLSLIKNVNEYDDSSFKPATRSCNSYWHDDFQSLSISLLQKGFVTEDDAYSLQLFLDSVSCCSKLLRCISDMTAIVLEDGVVTNKESDILLAMLSYALDHKFQPEASRTQSIKPNFVKYGVQETHLPQIEGLTIPDNYKPVPKEIPSNYKDRWSYIANHPFRTLSGAFIVITGEGKKISRYDAEKYSSLMGAIIKSSTTRTTDICVVLGEPPESCTTNKVVRAREQKSNGSSIVILDEDSFIELIKSSISENVNKD